jgi:hypothetical protein
MESHAAEQVRMLMVHPDRNDETRPMRQPRPDPADCGGDTTQVSSQVPSLLRARLVVLC